MPFTALVMASSLGKGNVVSDVIFKVSEDIDELFIALLDDNLKRILETDSKPHISLDDNRFNLRLARSILSLMMFHKDTASFDYWVDSIYMPTIVNYNIYFKEYMIEDNEE